MYDVLIFITDTTGSMTMNPNEIYEVHSDYIETKPNEVYGLTVQVSQQYISAVAHTETDGRPSCAPIYDNVTNLT